jgi:hypothetical protein
VKDERGLKIGGWYEMMREGGDGAEVNASARTEGVKLVFSVR